MTHHTIETRSGKSSSVFVINKFEVRVDTDGILDVCACITRVRMMVKCIDNVF